MTSKEFFVAEAKAPRVGICEICGDEFVVHRQGQKYCQQCGKNPNSARRKFDAAVRINKWNAGEYDPWRTVPPIRLCAECGKEYRSPYRFEFCSRRCEKDHLAKESRCPICRVYLLEKGIYSTRNICCSRECEEEYQKRQAIKEGRYTPCEGCGKLFVHPKGGQRFCSRECYRLSVQKTSDNSQGRKTRKSYTHICPICEKTYETFSYNQICCSKECTEILRRKKLEEAKEKRAEARKKRAEEAEKKKEKANASPKNICLTCRTSQSQCERFTSNFRYLPKDAVMKKVKGKLVVVSCPKCS